MTTTDTPRPTRADALAAVERFDRASASFWRRPFDRRGMREANAAQSALIEIIEALTPEPDQHAGAVDYICPTCSRTYRGPEPVCPVCGDTYVTAPAPGEGPTADQVTISHATAEQARQALALAKTVLDSLATKDGPRTIFAHIDAAETEILSALAAADGREP